MMGFNNTEENNMGMMDLLNIFGVFLGMLNYQENLEQTSNNELRDILDRQTIDIITEIQTTQKIIMENQKTIIDLLRREGYES